MPLPDGTTITWYGHSVVRIDTAGGKTVLIDPFFENPKSPIKADAVDRCDLLLVTHGHFDHMGDAVALASRAAAGVAVHARDEPVAGPPAAGRRGCRGRLQQGRHGRGGRPARSRWSRRTTRPATGTRRGETTLYLGDPAGFVIELEDGYRIYHAGDTEPFSDMRLIRDLHRPDLAMLPIGGHYTMGPTGAALAVEFLGVQDVVPLHYGTFPILAGTPAQLREALAARGLGSVTVHEPKPGGTLG